MGEYHPGDRSRISAMMALASLYRCDNLIIGIDNYNNMLGINRLHECGGIP